jgi:dTDP-4-amino-4,6-dideoxygalactose transaminase
MLDERIYLSPPHETGFEKDYIFKSSNWLNVRGDNVGAFENSLSSFVGNERQVAVVQSGTAALHLALILLGVSKGDEVLCQSMTFSASANPIVYQGAKPIFVDSESETWNICPDVLENAIKDRLKKGKRPKAIIAVDLYGMPFKYDEIKSLSIKYEIPIVEDSAEAFGSSYKGKMCGTLGNISVFSFNGNKIISTSGGGAILLKEKELRDKAVYLATQARDFASHYQHSAIGYNYRMSNLNASIGLGQLKGFEKFLKSRHQNHLFYQAIFEKMNDICFLTEPSEDFKSNHWLNAIVLESYDKREALRMAFESANIETRPLWKPMHLQPIFKRNSFYGGTVSETLFNKGLCLPSGSNLTEENKNRIQKVLSRFFE